MPATLVVPADLHDSLTAFVAEQGLSLVVGLEAPASEDAMAIEVIQGDRSQDCGPKLLVAGGRMRCATALAMARSTGVPALGIGALLDELSIKVNHCSLGCF